MSLSDAFIIGMALVSAAWLLSPQVRRSRSWQATITPLASIIGSGFLVAAPLVAVIAGNAAPVAMLAIVTLAYVIGGVIRFNIRHLEPILRDRSKSADGILILEKISAVVLSVAYIVSVAFYLRLMSSFVLHGVISEHTEIYANLITTFILIFIGIVGYYFGLHALEKLEGYSVTVKLAIIAALLLGLGMFDLRSFDAALRNDIPVTNHDGFYKLRMLAGLLLVVQGFETSRYLGAEYDAEMRITTMRRAQFASSIIYVVFVLFAMPLLTHLEGTDPDETALIDLTRLVSPVLPTMLIVAAVMSQFSASVADTVGGGGLMAEGSGGKVSVRFSYLIVTSAAIALVWFADLFQIISIASRAFAFYYLLQGINAWQTAGKCFRGWRCRLQRLRFAAVILILAFVVIFGHGAE